MALLGHGARFLGNLTCTFLGIVILEGNVQRPCPFLCMLTLQPPHFPAQVQQCAENVFCKQTNTHTSINYIPRYSLWTKELHTVIRYGLSLTTKMLCNF